MVVLKVHIDEPLIRPVERNAPLSHGHHRIIFTHVRLEDHDSSIE